MLPMLAVVIVILFVAAALSVDIARVHVTRSELRTATDAAARAAVEALGREQSQDAAITAALEIANANQVAGTGLTLDPNNIRFGTASENGDGSFSFNEGARSDQLGSCHWHSNQRFTRRPGWPAFRSHLWSFRI